METRPGYRTTEFWLSLAAMLLGAAFASGLLACPTEGCGPTMQAIIRLAGVAATVLGGFGYTVSRGIAKAGVPNAPLPKP